MHNYLLESDASLIESQLAELKERVTDINRSRKNFQLGLGERIGHLERKWNESVSTVLQLEIANAGLMGEIEELKERERELSGLVNGS